MAFLLHAGSTARNQKGGMRLQHKAQPPVIRFALDQNDTFSLNVAGESVGTHMFAGGDYDRITQTIENNVQEHELDWPNKVQTVGKLQWHRLSKSKKVATKRVLLAQYSNHGPEHDIFRLTQPINLEYAKRWKQDIVFLNAADEPETKYNLASLLQFALDHRQRYDQLLLLNADACMSDLDYDISDFLPGKYMLGAKRIYGNDPVHSWKIYATASVWNLHHLLVPRIESTWRERYNDEIVTLKEQVKPYETEIFTVTREIGYTDQAIIKSIQHFSMSTHEKRVVDDSKRLERWRVETQKICAKYQLSCP